VTHDASHTLHVTSHTSHITRYKSHVTRYKSHVKRHAPIIMQAAGKVALCHQVAMHLRCEKCVTCHMSHATCHMSHITCRMSLVTCHMSMHLRPETDAQRMQHTAHTAH